MFEPHSLIRDSFVKHFIIRWTINGSPVIPTKVTITDDEAGGSIEETILIDTHQDGDIISCEAVQDYTEKVVKAEMELKVRLVTQLV